MWESVFGNAGDKYELCQNHLKMPYFDINRKGYQTSASGNILIVLTFTAVHWLSDEGDDDNDDNDDNDDSDDNGS